MKHASSHPPAHRIQSFAHRGTPKPQARPGQVLVRVHACGICRTDLHVVEGELAPRKSPIVPATRWWAWWKRTEATRRASSRARAWAFPGCTQTCAPANTPFRAREPLRARRIHRWMVDGGYAEYVVAPEDFRLRTAEGLQRPACRFRTLRLSGVQRADDSPFTASPPRRTAARNSRRGHDLCSRRRFAERRVNGILRSLVTTPYHRVSPAWPKAKIRSVPEPSQAPFPL